MSAVIVISVRVSLAVAASRIDVRIALRLSTCSILHLSPAIAVTEVVDALLRQRQPL